MTRNNRSVNCYDFPQYWDLAFRSETKLETDFIEAACRKYSRQPVHRLLEPACGGGRLVVAMSERAYDVVAFDQSSQAVDYLRKRLLRRKLHADVFEADMTDFRIQPPVDAAFCTFNTFRHLTSEQTARRHLQSVAASLRRGGIYVLGLHLLPPDADDEDCERWTARHGRTRIAVTARVLDWDRRRRTEVLRFNLRVRSGRHDLRLRSDYTLRTYSAAQIRRLFASVPEFELCDVYDFCYEIGEPLALTDEMGDTVFILRTV